MATAGSADAKTVGTNSASFARAPELPLLRQEYVDAVNALAEKNVLMKAEGIPMEQIARELHANRRTLGEQFKALTPPDKLAEIYQRNQDKYGDKLGPSIEFLRSQGKSWDPIISSASRAGEKDLGF